MDARVQIVDEHLAHVEPLGDELLGVAVAAAVERGRVDERLVLAVEHRHQPVVLLGEAREQADEVGAAVGEVRAELLELRHELAAVGDDALEPLGERRAGRGTVPQGPVSRVSCVSHSCAES